MPTQVAFCDLAERYTCRVLEHPAGVPFTEQGYLAHKEKPPPPWHIAGCEMRPCPRKLPRVCKVAARMHNARMHNAGFK